MTIPFIQPPTWTTGQVLNRANVSILLDNDDLFKGLCDRPRPVPYGVERSWVGDELSLIVWDGFHYLESDATTLNYYLTLSGRDSTGTLTLWYDFDNVGAKTQIVQLSSNTKAESTYDLSSFYSSHGAGLYRVQAVLARDADGYDENLTGLVRAPYTSYTGGQSFTSPPTIADAVTGTAAHFNTFRSNDLLFNDCIPRQPAFVGLSGTHIASATSYVLWRGWIKHRASRVHYYLELSCDNTNNPDNHGVRIVYDPDGENETVVNWTTHGETTSYKDLTGTYTVGTWYEVEVTHYRDNDNYDSDAEVKYILPSSPIDAAGGETSFDLQDELAANQWVYGDTAGQETRLEKLSDNDQHIYEVLCWGDVDEGRHDFAVSKPEYSVLAGTRTGDYRLLRRGTFLYYRATNAQILWGTDQSESLDDYGTDEYKILDLNGVDIPPGTIYAIQGDLEYAMEK